MPFTRVWNAAYETVPDGTRQVNLGDDDINDFKTDVRERLDLEHDYGNASGTDTGRHRFPTGNLATRNGIADLIAAGQIFLRTDRAGLDHRLASAWVQRYFYDILTTAARTALTNVDKGYLVFDTDLDAWFYGDGAGGWRNQGGLIDIQITPATVANESPGATATWTDISGLTKAVAVPNDGIDYLIVVILVVKHEVAPNDVAGFRILEDATSRDVVITKGDNTPISTSVAMWVKTNPANNTTYTFKGQMVKEAIPANGLDVNPDENLAGVPTTAFSQMITMLIRRAV